MLSLSDIRSIFERLKQLVDREADQRINALEKPQDLTDDQWTERKRVIRQEAFRVTITIAGQGAEELFGDSAQLFDSPNCPEDIRHVYLTNVTAFESFTRQRPLNAFTLYLDFSKPALMDMLETIGMDQ
jgi:hypothetical protein